MRKPKGRPESDFVGGTILTLVMTDLTEVGAKVDRLDLVVDKLSDVPGQVVVPVRRFKAESVSTHPSINGVSLSSWLTTLIL